MTPRRALVLVLIALILLPPPARAQGIDAKRREAVRLQAELARRGQALSVATEDYNEARVRLDGVEGKLARVRRDLEAADARWSTLKARLGARIRRMYMHPASWAAPWLSAATSLAEFSRGRALAGSVLESDTDLLLATERARAERAARKRELDDARAVARDDERALAGRRERVLDAFRAQAAVLARVQGELAQLIEAERRRRLEEAARRAAQAKEGGGLPAPKPSGPVRPAAAKALSAASAQIGKPYEWGASGPGSFDCSGLTMYAWSAAGVSLPHSSRAQYSSLPKVGPKDIQPGDLLFFGSPIHHVGIYEGGGVMINAPETGENVRRASIYRRDYAGAARP